MAPHRIVCQSQSIGNLFWRQRGLSQKLNNVTSRSSQFCINGLLHFQGSGVAAWKLRNIFVISPWAVIFLQMLFLSVAVVVLAVTAVLVATPTAIDEEMIRGVTSVQRTQ